MCGINLIIDKTKSLPHDIIQTMATNSVHRGPDDTGIKVIDTAAQTYHLAVNRLKITDHSENAAQPFASPDNKCILLFNGEIYNHYTLKNELLTKGVRFSSHSDTEVLFHWLMIFGESRIDELSGMFAFAFINTEESKLIMARDRFGIKPIYYFNNQQYFLASSEIQPLVRTKLFPKKLNEDQIYHYLKYKYAKPPETLFKDVAELLPGQVLTFHSNEQKINAFTNSVKKPTPDTTNLKEIEDQLKESLLQQFNASVPVGLLLSGGVDSTLLLALAKSEGYSIPSFSIVNSNKDRSFGTEDYKFARKAADMYNSDHHELKVDISILHQFKSFISKMDQPIGDSSYLMTSEICRFASQSDFETGSIKILLSGAGADELFGGYNRHWAFYKYLNHKGRISLVNPFLKPLTRYLPTGFNHPLRKQFRLAKKLFHTFDDSPETTFHKSLIFDQFMNDNLPIEEKKHFTKSDWLFWALDHDLKNFLISDVLALSDKAPMQHSIELRVPYLSEELTNIIKNANPEFIFQNGRKWILKQILTKYGGKKFAERPKEGFGLPLGHWITDKKIGHLWEFANNAEHQIFKFIDQRLIQTLLSEQKRKKADHGPFLWAVLTLAHWLDHNFS